MTTQQQIAIGRNRVCYYPAWDWQRDWAVRARHRTEFIEYPQTGYGRGRGNGFARNLAMAEYRDALVLVWDGKSTGSGNMLEIARKCNLRRLVWTPDGVIE